jgi:hypothetical protein
MYDVLFDNLVPADELASLFARSLWGSNDLRTWASRYGWEFGLSHTSMA